MFQLTDLRKTRFWKEIHAEGREEGRTRAHLEFVRKFVAQGMSAKEIAAFLEISPPQVRKLIMQASQ